MTVTRKKLTPTTTSPISVKEAKKLGQSLTSLRDFTTSDRKIHNQLLSRSHSLVEENIKLFDMYVNSCSNSGFCDKEMLRKLLSGIQENLDIDCISSSFHFSNAQQIMALIKVFNQNLEDDKEGKLDEVHDTIQKSVSCTQNSYAIILAELNAMPRAHVPQNNIQQGLENLRAKGLDIKQEIFTPLAITQLILWTNIREKLNEALTDNVKDQKNASYMMRF